ncbi:MAG TPA: glycosyltransferase [Methylibium sp.]|nr:glycosyltransferase [Methylibium sp.]
MSPTRAATIDLVYFNAGGGHRASALALQASIAQLGLPWTVRLVNLFELLDPNEAFRRVTGFAPEAVYNQRLARGWTLGLAQELKVLQAAIRFAHPTLLRVLTQHWAASEPDLVVSLVPNFNRAMGEAVAAALPGVPYVTVLTDLADHPPSFWIEPGIAQHVVCGTPQAVAQARAAGLPAERIHASSGMILRPAFYAPRRTDRAAERGRLGLDPERPTGLVMFGGQGSKAMLGIAAALHDTPLILVCGHNDKLAAKLRALPASAPRHVVGFTADIPAQMQLADFFIGKPGPGSVSEAVQQGLPVIVVRNAWTMPQERYNAQWVRDNGLGLVLPSFKGVRAAAAELVAGLDGYRAALARIDNRAVFELPAILARLLEASRCVDGTPQPMALAD